MSDNLQIYMGCYLIALALAVLIAYRVRRRLDLFTPGYWLFLFVPWKLGAFAIAAGILILSAPFGGIPAWDIPSSVFMSLLAFLTAPWTIGVLYKALRRERPLTHAYIALCVALFSAAWSYDLYILWRDGAYPITWKSNLPVSGFVYFLAGLFWSLDWSPGTGATFAFKDPGWPKPPETPRFSKLLVWLVLLGLPVLLAFGAVAIAMRRIEY